MFFLLSDQPYLRLFFNSPRYGHDANFFFFFSTCWFVWFYCFVLIMNEILSLIADDSVIALANRCPHLRSLGLYFCKNITDNAMYSLAQSKVKNRMWGSVKGGNDEDGLRTLNISQCTALTPSAVQAVCDSSPALHTCSGRHSLIMSGCLNLTSVHCACAVHAHRAINTFPHSAH
jgi:F-box and leucine-rich repeat protein 1 (S-phase kinase-associated protein 2)